MSNDPAPHADDVLARAARGDKAALQELLLRNLPQLEAYVRLQTGAAIRQKGSISDLVQSVCVAALGDLGGFDFRGEPQFRHWMCKQALHKLINKREYYGAQKRDMAREVHAAADPASDAGADPLLQCYATMCTPSRNASGREQLQRFETAFAALPEDYREAITLQRLVGLDYPEIAAIMQRSEGAVRNLAYRGLARLTTLLP